MKWKKWCRNMWVLQVFLLAGIIGVRTGWIASSGQEGNELQEVTQNLVNDAGAEETEGMEEITEKPKIALTFDDGPHPYYTEILLDGLKERGVQATFFIIGKNIEGNEELIKRMHEEGHVIGNHTYDHVDLKELSTEEACEQIEKTNQLIYNIIGEYPGYLRPPFGNWDESIECGTDMMVMLWDIDSKDWTTTNIDEIAARVIKNAKENGIILMHDWYKSSVTAALQVVDALQAAGYDFVLADEILLD